MFLQGSYFYDLVRQQHSWMVQKQTALEAVRVLAVPGTTFLNGIGTPAVFKSSLFYLLLLGCIFLVFMLFSLLFGSPWKRALFLAAGLLALLALTIQDRINVSFPLILCISFASFYLLTLPCRIVFSRKEILLFLLLIIVVSGSLFYGSRHKFFVKARDRVLFDTTLGNRIISFYYTHSPLAASLISPEKGVYEGLVFYEDVKGEKPLYLGEGVFLSGKKELRGAASFVISKTGEKLLIENRHGKTAIIDSIDTKAIHEAMETLFSMKGFLLLNRAALYFFPAGVLCLCLVGVKWLMNDKRAFTLSAIGLGSVLLLFIWSVSLTGNTPPKGDRLKSATLSQDGLSIAHYLDKIKETPEAYRPFVIKMTKSESAVLRYWGANLLGTLGDRHEAQTLMTLIEDPCLNIRYTAASSLHRLLGEESFRPLLMRLISDPSWYVRCKIFSVFLRAGVIPSPA